MNKRHSKFMREVFGPETPEDRKRRREIARELRGQSDQGQQTPSALPGKPSQDEPKEGPACPPTGGPDLTVLVGILEDEVIALRHKLKWVPRWQWRQVPRDNVGTFWVNVRALCTRLSDLERDLQAYLDFTSHEV